jgi:ribosomal-protein-alanine N-acetyltransferase
MNVNMNIIPLVLEDCKKAAHLHQNAFETGWEESSFQELLQTPLITGIKVEEEGKFLGYILWREIIDEAEILTFVVHPEHQQKGVGTYLLQNVCAWLKDKGISRIFLEVAEDNVKALAFYQKWEFTFLSKRPQYYSRKGKGYVAALNCSKELI